LVTLTAPVRRLFSPLRERVEENAGGPARAKVIVLLGAALALDSADKGTIGAVAAELERHLGITHLQVGLLATISTAVGALATVPVGMLTDRFNRVRLLAFSVVLWALAMVATGAAPSYGVLLLSRLALGAVTATAGPTLASLMGDLFPARERAAMWGLVLTGELAGGGVGLLVSGDIAGVLSWRWAFWWLVIPSAALAVALLRMLPEPARGGQSRLEPGASDLVGADEAEQDGEATATDSDGHDAGAAARIVKQRGVKPDLDLVLHGDPAQLPLGAAVRYVLRIRTNVILIAASAISYLFFAGVQVFAVVLLRSRYGLGQAAASSLAAVIGLGALAGVIAGGRLADTLLRRGRINARIVVGAAAALIAAVVLLPAFASPWLWVSLPLLVLGAGAWSAANPALNAARLDIMPPRLWGRAEGVRTFVQMGAVAAAPLLFGLVSQLLGGPSSSARGAEHGNGTALALTFIIMLVPVAISGLVVLRARSTYARDVATAVASADVSGH
jgi:predicted MFS family arabinose efflux permease